MMSLYSLSIALFLGFGYYLIGGLCFQLLIKTISSSYRFFGIRKIDVYKIKLIWPVFFLILIVGLIVKGIRVIMKTDSKRAL